MRAHTHAHSVTNTHSVTKIHTQTRARRPHTLGDTNASASASANKQTRAHILGGRGLPVRARGPCRARTGPRAHAVRSGSRTPARRCSAIIRVATCCNAYLWSLPAALPCPCSGRAPTQAAAGTARSALPAGRAEGTHACLRCRPVLDSSVAQQVLRVLQYPAEGGPAGTEGTEVPFRGGPNRC